MRLGLLRWLVLLPALALLPRPALAQDDPYGTYPYPTTPPAYPAPPPPTYLPPPPPAPVYPPPRYYPPRPPRPPRYLAPPPASPDPFAGRFLRAYFGAAGFPTFVLHQDGGAEAVDHGGGLKVFGGLDIGPVVGVQVAYSDTFHNPDTACDPGYGVCSTSSLQLQMVTADLRLHLPTGTPFRPFLQAGIGTAWIGRPDYAADAMGWVWNAGAGFDYFLGRYVSFGLAALYHDVRMTDYGTITGGETHLALLTADANLALHF